MPRRARSAWGSGFQLAQAFREQPECPVEPDVLVDALDMPGALLAPVGTAASQAAFDDVLLDPVERGPQVRKVVVEATGVQDLAFRDRQGLARFVVLEDQGRSGEDLGLAIVERDGTHGVARILHLLESMQHLVGTLDHVVGDIALVGYAHVGESVAAHQTVLADEAEHAGQHLVAAGAVVRVEQDDLVHLGAVDLTCVAKAQHVLGVVAAVLLAHAGLAHHEWLEALLAQFGQHSRRGDVAVPFGAALVRGVREDGRGHGANLIVRQRVT